MKKSIKLFSFIFALSVGSVFARELKISVFASSVYDIARQRKVSVAEAALLLKDAGVDGFDVNYTSRRLDELSKTCLRPCNVYGFPHLLDEKKCDGDLAQFVAVAAKFGAPRIMCVPSDFTDGKPNEIDYLRCRDAIGKLVAMAKAKNIAVMIEDFGGMSNPCSYAACVRRFMSDVPELRFAVDSGNLFYAGRGDDILELQKWAIGRIEHVHLKDMTVPREERYVSLGQGAVPNREIVQRAQRNGYDGWYTIENPVGPDILDDVIRQIAVLRSWSVEVP